MQNRKEFDARYVYDPQRPMNEGGQAFIYRAWDREEQRMVAVKRAAYQGEKMERYSVVQEFERARTFDHPNLLKYYEVHRINTEMGRFDYGIMELVEGGLTLDGFIKTRPPAEEIHDVLRGILAGLKYLHQRDVVHRDLKPSNILIQKENGRPIPKIIDFGVSKEMSSSETSHSSIVGTKPYMAPEQIILKKGEAIHPNCDLWSFGVILFKIAVGKSPFGLPEEGYTNEQIQSNILDMRFQASLKNVGEPYLTMINRCLVKDNNLRVKTAGELLGLLENIAHPPVYRHRPAPPTPVRRPLKIKSPNVTQIIYSLTVVLLISVIIFLVNEILKPPIPPTPYLTESCKGLAFEEAKLCTETHIKEAIERNLKYPESAKSQGITGTVIATFDIGVTGSFMNINILQDIGGGCGDALKLAIEKAGSELSLHPATENGKAKITEYTHTHEFKITR